MPRTPAVGLLRGLPEKVVAQAPVRIDFTGGYTDVAPFTEESGGRQINATINRYAFIEVRRRTDGGVYIRSEDLDTSVQARSVEALHLDGRLDLLKVAILDRLPLLRSGIDITVWSTAPSGAGLGTSAAVGVAITGALDALCGRTDTREAISERAAGLERRSGTAGGRQDQYAAAIGGLNYLEFEGAKTRIAPITLSARQRATLCSHLLLAYKEGSARHSGDLITEVLDAYVSGDETTRRTLLSLNELALDIHAALSSFDLYTLGKLIDAIRLCQESLHPRLVSAEARSFLDQVMDAGAWSGKVLGGAGPGACALVFSEPNTQTSVLKAVRRAGWQPLPFSFEDRGLTVAAHRLR